MNDLERIFYHKQFSRKAAKLAKKTNYVGVVCVRKRPCTGEIVLTKSKPDPLTYCTGDLQCCPYNGYHIIYHFLRLYDDKELTGRLYT